MKKVRTGFSLPAEIYKEAKRMATELDTTINLVIEESMKYAMKNLKEGQKIPHRGEFGLLIEVAPELSADLAAEFRIFCRMQDRKYSDTVTWGIENWAIKTRIKLG